MLGPYLGMDSLLVSDYCIVCLAKPADKIAFAMYSLHNTASVIPE